jgi:hypothetical protein
MKYVTKTIGRCLTETKLENFDEVSANYTMFISVSQFEPQPKTFQEIGKAIVSTEAKILNGHYLYAKQESGGLLKLGSIVDSSD